MRSTILFNHDWFFVPQQVDPTDEGAAWQQITLPHSNMLLPYNNFDDQVYQFISTYRKKFTLPEPLNGRRIWLDFEGAMVASTVSINGHTFDEYRGGYTPFSFDMADWVNETGENVLTVHLDSTERTDIPPFGYVVDYLTFGGIYRDVFLRYVEPVHIINARMWANDVLSGKPRSMIDVWIRNDDAREHTVKLDAGFQAGQAESTAFDTVIIAAGQTQKVTLTLSQVDVALWQPHDPQQYDVKIQLLETDTSSQLDAYSFKFGFREAQFREDGFYLNGERLQLRGLNRHQTYPYIGAAAPARLQRRDADIVKYELGCNLVRTSHYPQSRHFLDRCDEIGLLVFEEIPGWQHIGDEAWQDLSLRDVRAMIERDWNRPSIILWGVRINESWDNTEFYTRTNALAHELDPTRQRGGVRFWPHSEFLEDVYTFNDFSNDIIEPTQSPWLVTEFNGHMFPTKTFDNEERRSEHARRHAYIQSRAATMGGVSGAIGWCAFDYNTHKEFGSGDRICYHGVMDIFRLPKWAAYFYGSQIDPSERIVLQAATMWTMGDRSEGGNDPFYVFTNCDEIEVFAAQETIGRFKPEQDEFPNLPHAPMKVGGLGMRWGEAFGDLRIVGYLDGDVVAEQRIAGDGQIAQLRLQLDDTEITADGMDMTRLSFMLVDSYGNPLPYAVRVITFDVDGPVDLLGENPFALVGGQAAVYLRAQEQTGEATIRASVNGLETVQIVLKLV